MKPGYLGLKNWMALPAVIALISVGCSKGHRNPSITTAPGAAHGVLPTGDPATVNPYNSTDSTKTAMSTDPLTSKYHYHNYEDQTLDGTDGSVHEATPDSDAGTYEQLGRENGVVIPDVHKEDQSQVITGTVDSTPQQQEVQAFRANDPNWYPGLPAEPFATPILTGGETARKYFFTDGKHDSLMAYLTQQFDSEDATLRKNSEDLAARVEDIDVWADIYDTAKLNMQLTLRDGKKRYVAKFQGKMDAHRQARLTQIDVKGDGDLRFAVVTTCLDQDGGCQNVIMRIDQYTNKKLCRRIFAITRFGDAHVTMPEPEKMYPANIKNVAHSLFASYMSNSYYNACLINKMRSDLPPRIKWAYQLECPFQQQKLPSAKHLGLRTFAVAYGASGFSFILDDNALNVGGAHPQDETVISGPLVYSNVSPIYDQKLSVRGEYHNNQWTRWSTLIKSANLINNDGGGNLNLKLTFVGDTDESSMRLSITTLMRNTVDPFGLESNSRENQQPDWVK